MKLLTLTELAKLWNTTRQTIWNWVQEGMPHTEGVGKNGRKILLFDLTACQRWYRGA